MSRTKDEKRALGRKDLRCRGCGRDLGRTSDRQAFGTYECCCGLGYCISGCCPGEPTETPPTAGPS